MARTPQRNRPSPTRRPPPRDAPGKKPALVRFQDRSAGKTEGSKFSARTGLLVAGGLIGFLIVLRLGASLLSGDPQAVTATGGTGPTGIVGSGDAPPPPPGSRSSNFPTAVDGTRLQLKVIALGDDPAECAAESLEVGNVIRTVYHHRCSSEDPTDRYFFLVQVTNLADARVYVSLENLSISTSTGSSRVALATPPLGSDSTRFLPESRAIAAEQVLKGWITVDGTDGFIPAGLSYADGEEALIVAFDGTWV
jgi:hypothetical protein